MQHLVEYEFLFDFEIRHIGIFARCDTGSVAGARALFY
jgi:hypothetical protein